MVYGICQAPRMQSPTGLDAKCKFSIKPGNTRYVSRVSEPLCHHKRTFQPSMRLNKYNADDLGYQLVNSSYLISNWYL